MFENQHFVFFFSLSIVRVRLILKKQTRLFQEDGAFIVRATKNIAAGDELVSEHEEMPRSECLRRYGTAPLDCAPFDVVDMPRDIICQEFEVSSTDDPRVSLEKKKKRSTSH